MSNVLGIIIKGVTAASSLAGIITLAMSYYGISFQQIPPGKLPYYGWAFLGIAVLLGAGDVIYERSKTDTPPSLAGDSQSVGSGNTGVILINKSPFRDLIYQPGDSDAVRAEKLNRAQSVLASEVISNLRALDARLNLIQGGLAPDKFEQKLASVRERLAPATAEANAGGYSKLIAAQRAASFRHALNSERLRSDIPGPLLQVLVDAKFSGETIQLFHQQLAEVEWATESLLGTLDEIAQSDNLAEEDRTYEDKRVDLALSVLRNRSKIAYLSRSP